MHATLSNIYIASDFINPPSPQLCPPQSHVRSQLSACMCSNCMILDLYLTNLLQTTSLFRFCQLGMIRLHVQILLHKKPSRIGPSASCVWSPRTATTVPWKTSSHTTCASALSAAVLLCHSTRPHLRLSAAA